MKGKDQFYKEYQIHAKSLIDHYNAYVETCKQAGIIPLESFQKSIERKLPKGVWAHDWKQPIAKTLEAKELAPGDPSLPSDLKTLGGCYIKGQFNLDTQRGREAYSDIKFGIVDEFSIGYSVLRESKDKDTGARELLEGDWKEWSPVLVGMNDRTELIEMT